MYNYNLQYLNQAVLRKLPRQKSLTRLTLPGYRQSQAFVEQMPAGWGPYRSYTYNMTYSKNMSALYNPHLYSINSTSLVIMSRRVTWKPNPPQRVNPHNGNLFIDDDVINDFHIIKEHGSVTYTKLHAVFIGDNKWRAKIYGDYPFAKKFVVEVSGESDECWLQIQAFVKENHRAITTDKERADEIAAQAAERIADLTSKNLETEL